MTDQPQPPFGTAAWRDLTVENADDLRDFYTAVAGWTAIPVSMGDYDDYDMRDQSGRSVAGICHAKGSNAKMPPQWLVYVMVEDTKLAAQTALEKGGQILDGPRDMGGGRMCVVKDPAGAVIALFEPQMENSDEMAPLSD